MSKVRVEEFSSGMRITVSVPPPEEVVRSGLEVPVAREGERWSVSYLGPYAKERGIYVIHHDRQIKYVGKTEMVGMSFGIWPGRIVQNAPEN